jgi:nucleoside-diphosphate-sugar epimerase
MGLPHVVVTGASGFVGRHLLEAICEDHRVFGIDFRSQRHGGVPEHPNITWLHADIGERPQIDAAFDQIAAHGPVDLVIHLAAHYDFTGEETDEYERTNVQGLRHVLDLSVALGVKHFLFSSSVAACRLPGPGRMLNEDSPPDGEHVYARTKRAGEEMLAEYQDRLTPVVLRFAALFSDWCEYPPLYMFLQTWLSSAWNRRILGGRGRSAIPYLHVRDLVLFLQQVIARLHELRPMEVLIASPDGCTSHEQLYEAATLAWFGTRSAPIHMPRPLCLPGIYARDLLGRITGNRPFERPWMARYIDTEMYIDASRTRRRLDWAPRERLGILRRVPFLVENIKTHPHEWNRRNREALRTVTLPVHLKIHWLIEAHEDEIVHEFNELLRGPEGRQRFPTYQAIAPEEHQWHHRVVLGHLKNAVRTRERGLFMAYCRDLAEQRVAQGFSADELCGALESLNVVCLRVLLREKDARELRQGLRDYVTATLRAGCDQAQEVFELAEARTRRTRARGAPTPPAP